jgi:hypothetical protein
MQVNPALQTFATKIDFQVGGTSAAAQSAQSTQSVKDTVSISSAALSALKAALQEATETSAQTAKEANSGDLQAQKLLAKEAAAKEALRS